MSRRKTGGRSAGTPNKTTATVRALITQLVNDNFDDFLQTYHSIEKAKDKAAIFIDLCKFVVPSLQSVALTTEEGQDRSIEESLSAMAQTLAEKK